MRLIRRLRRGPIAFVILDELASAAYALELHLEDLGRTLEAAARRRAP